MRRNRLTKWERERLAHLESFRLAEGLELMDDDDARLAREDADDRDRTWYGFTIGDHIGDGMIS